ncbi:MAG: Tim44 domain-containing protein [Rhodobacteraceae bacterium]|nr:Tim44 domain-containing protein [Paracoccaceae bacterium]
MSSSIIQILVLAAVAVFLLLKLRSVLGTREGFEKPPLPIPAGPQINPRGFEVIDGGPDHDVIDHAPEGSATAKALSEMKRVEPAFRVGSFMGGARGAYEMILTAFDKGDLTSIRPFLGPDVAEAFETVIADRAAKGLEVQSNFVGLRELSLVSATFDPRSKEAEITLRLVGELTTTVRNAKGEIVEGSPTEIRRQRDVWTFARQMGSANPNWALVATGD